MNTFFATVILLSIFLLSGCATPQSVGRIDSSRHHVFNGFKFLDRNMIEEAEIEFRAAREKDPQYGPGHAGMAIIRVREGHFGLGHHLLNQALTYSSDASTQYLAHVAGIRLYTEEKSKGWVENALAFYNRAVRVDPLPMDAYYFMGLAYKESFNFQDAGKMFSRALECPGEYYKEARKEFELMQAIQQYPPDSMIGKKVALAVQVNRAEVAALFAEELNLNEIVKDRQPSQPPPRTIPDIEDHPYRESIEFMIQSGICGFLVYPDNTFRPEAPLTRKDLAIITQNILLQTTDRTDLESLFSKQKSPFSDVSKVSPRFQCRYVGGKLGTDAGS